LENLTSVEYLSLFGNASLTSLAALENLTLVNNLSIRNNRSLVNLIGLENIDHDTLTNVSITENRNLFVCHVESICNYLENGGTSTIEENAPGCNAPEEVEAAGSRWFCDQLP